MYGLTQSPPGRWNSNRFAFVCVFFVVFFATVPPSGCGCWRLVLRSTSTQALTATSASPSRQSPSLTSVAREIDRGVQLRSVGGHATCGVPDRLYGDDAVASSSRASAPASPKHPPQICHRIAGMRDR